MRVLKKLAEGAGLAVALIGVLPAAWADPPAPSGWSREPSGSMSAYRPNSDGSVVLRLYPVETAALSLDAWFRGRIDTPPADLAGMTFGKVEGSRPDTRTAVGLSGQRIVMAIGCQRKDASKRFAELVAPADPAMIQRHADTAASILAQACLNAGPSSSAPTSSAEKGSGTAGRGLGVGAAQPPVGPGAPVQKHAGRGLPNEAIEGVLYSWDQIYEVTGLRLAEWTYLLLKDGTVRQDVPSAAPRDFDAIEEKRANPGVWGRWRRAGGQIEVDLGDGFEAPPGQMMRVPGKRGERLSGSYQGASSASFLGGAGSWSRWGLKLDASGRFERWMTGGAGGTTGFGDTAVTSGVVYDDRGSSSSASSGVFGGGATRSTGITDKDLEGTYEIDGWSMELRYDSGKIQRGFFFTSPDRTTIWFEGIELYIPKEDR